MSYDDRKAFLLKVAVKVREMMRYRSESDRIEHLILEAVIRGFENGVNGTFPDYAIFKLAENAILREPEFQTYLRLREKFGG